MCIKTFDVNHDRKKRLGVEVSLARFAYKPSSQISFHAGKVWLLWTIFFLWFVVQLCLLRRSGLV